MTLERRTGDATIERQRENSPAARATTEPLREGEATAARRGAATAARLEGEATHLAVERVAIIAENDIILERCV